MDIMDMMRSGSGGSFDAYGSAERMIEDVKAAGERFLNRPECPFEIGDIITPKKNSNKKGRGLPHFLAEKFPVERSRDEAGEPEENTDIVVVCMLEGGKMSRAFRNDSTYFELFDPEKVTTD